jgi:hypothetical protein
VTVCQVAFAYSPTATTANYTIYKADSISGDNLHVVSVLEGTTDRVYNVGDIVEVRLTAGTLNDVQNAINTLEAGGGGGGTPGGSSGQFQYNNSGAFGGSSLVSQNTTTVAVQGGTTGTLPMSIKQASGTLVNGGTSISNNPALQVLNNAGTPLVSFNHYWNTGDTDYTAGHVWVTNIFATTGPSPANRAPSIQVWSQDTNHRAMVGLSVSGQAPTNDLYFTVYSSTNGASEAFHCSNNDNTTGPSFYLPIYSSGRFGIQIKAASGQTADLEQWQNSSGTVLSAVGPAGHVRTVLSAGAPTGTPPNGSMAYDTTNNKFYVYNGAWKSVTLA